MVGSAAAAAAAATNGFVIEPKRIEITRNTFKSAGDRSGQVIRIVQISDLHLQRVTSYEYRIANATNDLKPDLIIITGDSVDKRHNVSLLGRFLALLEPECRKVAILGNWEHWGGVDLGELNAQYQGFGCQLLVNETAHLEINGAEIQITGMDDWTGGRPDLGAALSEVTVRPNHLILAHSPVYRDIMYKEALMPGIGSTTSVSDYNIACILAGHTHGGQIALLGWAPVRPRGSGRYLAGWYRGGGKAPLYVSRGIGTSILPIRIGAVPEVSFFEWQLAKSPS